MEITNEELKRIHEEALRKQVGLEEEYPVKNMDKDNSVGDFVTGNFKPPNREAVLTQLKAVWLAGNCIKEFRPDEVPTEILGDIADQILSLMPKVLSRGEIIYALIKIQPGGFHWGDVTESEMVKFEAISQATIERE